LFGSPDKEENLRDKKLAILESCIGYKDAIVSILNEHRKEKYLKRIGLTWKYVSKVIS